MLSSFSSQLCSTKDQDLRALIRKRRHKELSPTKPISGSEGEEEMGKVRVDLASVVQRPERYGNLVCSSVVNIFVPILALVSIFLDICFESLSICRPSSRTHGTGRLLQRAIRGIHGDSRISSRRLLSRPSKRSSSDANKSTSRSGQEAYQGGQRLHAHARTNTHACGCVCV